MATENPNSNEVRPHSAAGMPQAGARTDANGNAVHNKILSALPDREFDDCARIWSSCNCNITGTFTSPRKKSTTPGFSTEAWCRWWSQPRMAAVWR